MNYVCIHTIMFLHDFANNKDAYISFIVAIDLLNLHTANKSYDTVINYQAQHC